MCLIQEQVREHSQLALDDRLAERFCAVAERAAKRLKVPKVLERTRSGVKAAQVVGVISVPGATLEILPKIDGPDEAVRKALLHMLCVARNLRPLAGEQPGVGGGARDLGQAHDRGRVLDTKWKELEPTDRTGKFGVGPGDVYQMLAYAQAHKAKRLVLLYPWVEGLDKGVNRQWRIAGTECQLDIAAVDVGEPRSVVCALREVVGTG